MTTESQYLVNVQKFNDAVWIAYCMLLQYKHLNQKVLSGMYRAKANQDGRAYRSTQARVREIEESLQVLEDFLLHFDVVSIELVRETRCINGS